MNAENLEFAYLVLNFKVHKLRIKTYTSHNGDKAQYIGFPFGFQRKYFLYEKNTFANVEDAIAFCKSILDEKEASALRRLEHIRNYKKYLESAPCEYMHDWR